MGMAAKIQQRNQVVDEQCVALQKRLAADGFRGCVLKGQGVAQLYSELLRGLRQSGDIDVLMWKDVFSFAENKRAVIEYAKNIDPNAEGAEHHVGVHLFQDTEVEMHYAPAYFCNPFANKRFRLWVEEHREPMDSGIGFMMPNKDFNLVFLLAHTFRHYMTEGVGLRQLMDYYFVLLSASQEDKNGSTGSPVKKAVLIKNSKNICEVLDSFNMLKFAGAVMWVMKEVFGLEREFMICEPNERLGRKLLAHIMQGGNFGHHNTETAASKQTHVGRFINQVAQDLSLSVYYPSEALWAPIAMIRDFIRIRI